MSFVLIAAAVVTATVSVLSYIKTQKTQKKLDELHLRVSSWEQFTGFRR